MRPVGRQLLIQYLANLRKHILVSRSILELAFVLLVSNIQHIYRHYTSITLTVIYAMVS